MGKLKNLQKRNKQFDLMTEQEKNELFSKYTICLESWEQLLWCQNIEESLNLIEENCGKDYFDFYDFHLFDQFQNQLKDLLKITEYMYNSYYGRKEVV